MTDAAARKRPTGLGRGLSALLGEQVREEPIAPGGERSPGVRTVPVSEIEPHPEQPRRHFDEEALDELARSIEARGLIQPIVVRPWQGGYQIVAGERRWRAAQRARLHQVPVIVRDFDEAETLELALVENIQREDLNAIEEAEAYAKLINRFGHSQEALGRIVHKSRSHIANLLRLLDLPASVRAMLAEGRLSMGHARALITAPDPEALAGQVVARGLSVRETEKLAQEARAAAARPPRAGKEADADIAALERQLGDILGLKVKIAYAKGTGSVTLGFSSLDQLDLICQRLTGERI
ncbi:ParB/RepB/Spo0J family partition protein [Sphingomonas sp. MAH-20]|uniref:ParB/RepB/Spo0J family partition protein n=1 Tax=Sphingomonas horti TaxID=2682842 RepID=A0A6I4IXK9_9SPHN|nr:MULTISPECIES: ParB/RepB/Spo0J family partition protein [Sphingomonas]MBA2920934.1 ParB/RepB/Spo0J family partition protein [Sphingomonas sp. CGMCC 1.13658]MVO76920.1 ParB/RepB/Spo0J family partition protein [Sphingomonas horti]